MPKQRPLVTFFLILLASSIFVGAQTYSVVYNFGTNVNDPGDPTPPGITAQGRDGALYSGAQSGGVYGFYGADFKITAAGFLTDVYSFGSGGTNPSAGLTLGTDGNFYGVTYSGFGSASNGTIYKLTPSGVLTTLYTFTGGVDGGSPCCPPVEGNDGNYYGTTIGFGGSPYGTIYKITPSGKFTLLYIFDVTHGRNPQSPLLLGSDGNFYGTASGGGAVGGAGVFFKVTTGGKLTVLYNFDGAANGLEPYGSIVQGNDGNYYGTTAYGGVGNPGSGIVYKMTPSGNITVLHSMNGTTDGGNPENGLALATDGNFYGGNFSGGPNVCGGLGCGTLFTITPSGSYSVIYDFDEVTGYSPDTTMFQSTNGILYGMALGGPSGTSGPGVFFSENIGAAPFASLVRFSGKTGAKVEILGQGFTGTSAVSFGSIAASFTVSSDTYLTATVPNGALTGSVVVTTPGATLTSNRSFLVTPQLKSFNPSSGPVNTQVTITGVSLTQTTKVTFGGASASFTVNSDSQITATVPTGAKTGKIQITTPGGTVSSKTNFTVT